MPVPSKWATYKVVVTGHSFGVSGKPGVESSTARTSLMSHLTTTAPTDTFATNPIMPPGDQREVFYSQFPLKRREELRKNEEEISGLLMSPTTKLVLVHGGKVLIAHTPGGQEVPPGSRKQAVFIEPATDGLSSAQEDPPPVFLGVDDEGRAYFTAAVKPEAVEQLAKVHGADWEYVRSVGPDLEPRLASMLAVAQGLVVWHGDAQYDGSTGQRTVPQPGGYSRSVQGSTRELYPRIDPAVITLVTCGDYCLLGNKEGWPRSRYSTLAGFLELGETLEQAVCREVEEESGVSVDPSSVRYFASQPWPFPRSLMVGFYASANQDFPLAYNPSGVTLWEMVPRLSDEGREAARSLGMSPAEVMPLLAPPLPPTVPQPGEMQQVRWFHKDWLRQMVYESAPKLRCLPDRSSFTIPGSYSLANMLITGWLGQANPEGEGGEKLTLQNIPEVELDSGVFKYVLLRVSDYEGASKIIVRGDSRAAYHINIVQRLQPQLVPSGLRLDVLGGGRIEHHPSQGVVHVYGYSGQFGVAPHEVTAALIRKWFPLYDAAGITLAYSGY